MASVWRQQPSWRLSAAALIPVANVCLVADDFFEAPDGPTYYGTLKFWTGTTWAQGVLKRWTGAAWAQGVLRRWDGAAWRLVRSS